MECRLEFGMTANRPRWKPLPVKPPHPIHGLLDWRKPSVETEAKSCPAGQCLFGGHMSANAANRVKDAVERVVDKIEKAADGTADRLNKLSEEALDKFHRVEKSVADPLEAALKGLDELLGSNGGPPLDEGK
jgi:hypothetical protein